MHSNRDAGWMTYIVEANRLGPRMDPKQNIARKGDRKRRSLATNIRGLASRFPGGCHQ
jgi:hypothetical protein